jgi:hypothetical protein
MKRARIVLRCYVCLESFATPAVVTKCGHVGHQQCVKKWVDHAHKCAECAAPLRTYEYSWVTGDVAKYRPRSAGTLGWSLPSLCGLEASLRPLVGLRPDQVNEVYASSLEVLTYVVSLVRDVLGKRAFPSEVLVSDLSKEVPQGVAVVCLADGLGPKADPKDGSLVDGSVRVIASPTRVSLGDARGVVVSLVF